MCFGSFVKSNRHHCANVLTPRTRACKEKTSVAHQLQISRSSNMHSLSASGATMQKASLAEPLLQSAVVSEAVAGSKLELSVFRRSSSDFTVRSAVSFEHISRFCRPFEEHMPACALNAHGVRAGPACGMFQMLDASTSSCTYRREMCGSYCTSDATACLAVSTGTWSTQWVMNTAICWFGEALLPARLPFVPRRTT